jgi:uncharacterized membrane protein YoaK (UPF0700 family)
MEAGTERGGATLTVRALVLGYSGLLAAVAGFVNSVALLVLAFPVGNLTALTTKLSMDTANPRLFESCMLTAIVGGFLAGAVAAGMALAPARTHTGPRHAAVLLAEAALLLAATADGETMTQAVLAAAGCGLQNAMTSNFRGMAIRTTHFTGTITDLGLMLGRSRYHGVDKWKATVLATSVVGFLVGGVAGTMIGGRIGVDALILPAVACLVVAVASVVYDRRRVRFAADTTATPEPV